MKTRRLIICRVGRRPATTPAGGDVYGLVDVELGSARHTNSWPIPTPAPRSPNEFPQA